MRAGEIAAGEGFAFESPFQGGRWSREASQLTKLEPFTRPIEIFANKLVHCSTFPLQLKACRPAFVWALGGRIPLSGFKVPVFIIVLPAR